MYHGPLLGHLLGVAPSTFTVYLEHSVWINLRDPKKKSRGLSPSSHSPSYVAVEFPFRKPLPGTAVPRAAGKEYPGTNSKQREKGACRIGVHLDEWLFLMLRLSNWIISPGRGEKKQIYLKPPASYQSLYMYIHPLSSQSIFRHAPPKSHHQFNIFNFCQLPTIFVHNRYPNQHQGRWFWANYHISPT